MTNRIAGLLSHPHTACLLPDFCTHPAFECQPEMFPSHQVLPSATLPCTLNICEISWVLLKNLSLKSVLNLSPKVAKGYISWKFSPALQEVSCHCCWKLPCQMAAVIKSVTGSDPEFALVAQDLKNASVNLRGKADHRTDSCKFA